MDLTDVFTDSMFLAGANNALWLHLNYTDQPVYFYVFGYRGNYSFSSDNDYFDYGVGHSDDLMYLFSPKLAFPEYEPSASDKNIRNTLSTLWVDFATFGNPTPTEDVSRRWQPVKSTNLEYYFISNFTGMDEKLYWNRTQLWKNLPLML
ncbi:hypothetical protein ILUMI_18828 [Ignelater luminosus]|uniref:Carboxylesterase type B domain-containing protein n=1 Tax=Ignelater luminosus TaxID=2038154 RepID=A0A8K0CHG5_IGNLU|nr:hypothetical protein ILUMI_18828 [Ignelater luminosus]